MYGIFIYFDMKTMNQCSIDQFSGFDQPNIIFFLSATIS